MGRRFLSVCAAAAFVAAAPGWADVGVGQSLYKHCANCHGSQGEGGEMGKYPRIAGLPKRYVERQLHDFKVKKRINKPMLPIFKDWRFNADAIESVAAYVSGLTANDLSIATFEPTAAALAEFESRQEFDEVGEEIFRSNCAQCHGDDGQGRADKEAPPLVRQYPAYLAKQIDDFAAGRREHEHAAKMFGEMYPEEREAVLAYLQVLDGK
jgi:cytochrome c553